MKGDHLAETTDWEGKKFKSGLFPWFVQKLDHYLPKQRLKVRWLFQKELKKRFFIDDSKSGNVSKGNVPAEGKSTKVATSPTCQKVWKSTFF